MSDRKRLSLYLPRATYVALREAAAERTRDRIRTTGDALLRVGPTQLAREVLEDWLAGRRSDENAQ
jgi:hypothetical protein